MAHKTPTWLKKFEFKKGERPSPNTEFKPKASWVEIPCKTCGKLVRLTKNHAENYWKGNCSKKCGYLSFSAEKHPNWKEGRAKENQRLRTTQDYRKWRMKVLVRDDFKCQNCGIENSWEAHHKVSFAKNPESRFEVNNGVCLCNKCHNETKNTRIKK